MNEPLTNPSDDSINSIMIRPATPADLPAILQMVAKICALHQAWDSAKYGFLPHVERRYEGWLKQLIHDDRDLCLVAEHQPPTSRETATLAAFLAATVEREIPIYTIKEFAFIHDLWVEDAYRHRGIARQLMMQAIAHFTQLGIPQIRLDTATANETARRLFSTCGFQVSTMEMLIEL